MSTNTLITRTSGRGLEPLHVRLLDRYGQIAGTLTQTLGPAHAALFAEPVRMGAGAGSNAIDRRDHRKRQRAQFLHQRIVESADGGAEIGPRVAAGQPVAKILSGAEAASGAGEQQRPAIGVGLGLRQCRHQGAMHGLGKGIEPLRPIQRDGVIACAFVDKDGGLVHRFLPDRRF